MPSTGTVKSLPSSTSKGVVQRSPPRGRGIGRNVKSIREVRSLSPASSRAGTARSSVRGRGREKGRVESDQRVRSLSPVSSRGEMSHSESKRGNNTRSTTKDSKRSKSYYREDRESVRKLMASYKIIVYTDVRFNETMILEEPMLRHVKLDDDINADLEQYGELAQDIKKRTKQGFDAFLDSKYDFSYHQYSIINDLKWRYYKGKHEKAADSIIRTAIVLEAQGHMESATLQKNAAMKMYKSLNVSKPKIIDVLSSLGNSCFLKKEYGNALGFYEEALRKTRKYLGASKDRTASATVNLGKTYSKLGRNDDAIRYLKQGLQLQQSSASVDKMDIAETLIELGDIYYYLRSKKEESTDSYKQAMKIYKKIGLEKDDPKMIRILNRIDGAVPDPHSGDSCFGSSCESEGENDVLRSFKFFVTSCTPENLAEASAAASLSMASSCGGLFGSLSELSAFACEKGMCYMRDSSSGAVDTVNEFMLLNGRCGEKADKKSDQEVREEIVEEDASIPEEIISTNEQIEEVQVESISIKPEGKKKHSVSKSIKFSRA
uniref:MalT-like TPR region domain-containing protein n=1 Tax=Ditylum brightwellii TaxID=49249 RepID=A0A7S4UM60_9STRA